jgi:3-hydroxyacyl-CoA dehydrogenase
MAFAEKVADARPLPKVRDRKVDYPNHEAFLQFSRNTVKAMAGLSRAARVRGNRGRFRHPKFEDGMKFERERFLHLMQTTESKALRHAFFAERVASKVPDVPADTPVRSIKQAAVIGAGTMGGGIAMNFLNAGIPVVLLETRQEALDKGMATIRKNYDNTVKKGKLTAEAGAAHGPADGHAGLCRYRPGRHRGGSRVRGHGRQGNRVPQLDA